MKKENIVTKLAVLVIFIAMTAYLAFSLISLFNTNITAPVYKVTVRKTSLVEGTVTHESQSLDIEGYTLVVSDGYYVENHAVIAVKAETEEAYEVLAYRQYLLDEIDRVYTISISYTNQKSAVLMEKLLEEIEVARENHDFVEMSSLVSQVSALTFNDEVGDYSLSELRAMLTELENTEVEGLTWLLSETAGIYYEGKIYGGATWYFTVYMEEEIYTDVEFYFPKPYDFTVTMTLVEVLEENGVYKHTFSSNEYLWRTVDIYEISAELEEFELEGLQIPVESVHLDDEGKTYVYIEVGSHSEIRYVNTLCKVDDNFIVEISAEDLYLDVEDIVIVS